MSKGFLLILFCPLLISCAVKKRAEFDGRVLAKAATQLPDGVILGASGNFLMHVSSDALQWGVDNKIRYRVVTKELEAVDASKVTLEVVYDMPLMPDMTLDGPFRPVSVTVVAPGEWEVLYDSLVHGGKPWEFRFELKQEGKVLEHFRHEVLRP